jgi:hypothetical protein
MSVGTILLRPQSFTRRLGPDEAQILDLVTGLSTRLIEDFARGGGASRIIMEAVSAHMQQLAATVEPRIETAHTHVMEWMNPYITAVESLKSATFSGPSDVIPLIEKILDVSLLFLNEFRSANIANRLNALADIAENDLGLGYGTFDTLFRGLFDNVIDALGASFLAGDTSEQATLNFAISRQMITLRRLLRSAASGVSLPTFNRRAIIRELQLQLESNGMNTTLDGIRQQIEEAKAKLTDALPVLQFSMSASVTVRAASAGGQYSWYASWFKDESICVADRMDLSGESFAPDMGIGLPENPPIGSAFLEQWAHWTYTLAEIVKAIQYGFQADKGNKLSPALHSVWQGLMAVNSLFAPLDHNSGEFLAFKNNSIFQLIVTELLSLGGSFESLPGHFREWLWINLFFDREKAGKGAKYPDMGYHFFLSLFTLINREGKNYTKVKGFTKPARVAGAYAAAAMLGRQDLYFTFGPRHWTLPPLVILLGGTITFAFEIIGWLLAGAVARKISTKYWEFSDNEFLTIVKEIATGKNAYGSFLLHAHLDFIAARDSLWHGNTSKGKFGVKMVLKADGSLESQPAELFEYPDKSTSPYKLPFPGGQLVFCSQAHNGISSHTYLLGRIYAVDFMLQNNQMILAMRAGVVVDYCDHLPYGSEAGKNYICIKHNTTVADHDKGIGGAASVTTARYEVAVPYGVQRAFLAKKISPDKIIGTPVNQGDIIMLLGERYGVFETDRLEVFVEATTTDGFLPTIPFVFADIADKGIPKYGKYYESGNAFDFPNQSRLVPATLHGLIRESGKDYVMLSDAAPNYNIAGTHITINYFLQGIGEVTEYRKIREYDTGNKHAKLDGIWHIGVPPPAGAKFQVGAASFVQASAFEKRFAYLASANDSNQGVPFADGREPDTIQNP